MERNIFAGRKTAIAQDPLTGSLLDILSPLAARLPGDGLAPYLEFDQQYYLPDDILVKSDRMSMAHSVEVRPPFLDHRIIEFAATLPTVFEDPRFRAEVRSSRN